MKRLPVVLMVALVLGVGLWFAWPTASEVAETPASPAPSEVPTPAPIPKKRAVPLPDLKWPKPAPELERSSCADLDAAAEAVMAGELTEEMAACLDARIAADDRTEDVLRLLVAKAWNEDRDEWAIRSAQLASITEDPDLHYKLVFHHAKAKQPEIALHHLEVTYAEAHRWPEELASKRTDNLDRVRAKLCTLVEQASDLEICD